VVALAVVEPEATLLVASENGIGKRTPFEDYRIQSRGGKGIITMKTTDKTGKVVGGLVVKEGDEIMLMTSAGQSVRIPVADVRETGRNTQGVKLMNLAKGESIQDVARVVTDDEIDAGGDEGSEAEGEAEAEAGEESKPSAGDGEGTAPEADGDSTGAEDEAGAEED
jgi:DNA gyrase subunit A